LPVQRRPFSALHAATAEPIRVSPPKAVVYLGLIKRDWSVKVLTERVNDTKAILSGETSRKAQPKRDPNIDRLERLIREQFCLPCEVTFSESQAKGKVTFTYHSLDELQGLLDAWGIEYQ
jgi:hypothetical protein